MNSCHTKIKQKLLDQHNITPLNQFIIEFTFNWISGIMQILINEFQFNHNVQ